MATAAKAVSGPALHPDGRFAPTLTSMTDALQLSPTVEGRVEPFELVELFYGSGSSTQPSPSTSHPSPTTTHTSHHSPRSNGTSSPEVMQVVEAGVRERDQRPCYTCEVCGRNFREASHFTKHKRGALCRKLAQRMAKNTKKKGGRGVEGGSERRGKAGVHKPYQCNVCGAKFCDRVNMELHLERQHSTRQQLWVELGRAGGSSCAECDRCFQDKAEAADHHRQHLSAYLAHPDPQQAPPPILYYHDPLQQVQPYTQPPPPPPPPPQPSHLPPPPVLPPAPPPAPPAAPQPPPVAHMQANMTTTILHPPHLAPPPSLIPISQIGNLPQTSPVSSLSSLSPMSSIGVGETGGVKGGKSNKGTGGGGKWNICGECGHRFIDPMNLELHIQRRHPASRLLDTVSLGGGTVLYKTTNSRPDIQCLLAQDPVPAPDPRGNRPNTQTFNCKLCGYKATARSYMLFHLQSVHATTNTDFIHVLETLECGRKGPRVKGKKVNQDSLLREQRHLCNVCGDFFLSKAELIRHRIKDKQYMCGVCCHASCSQKEILAHMATQHPHLPHLPQGVSGGLECWLCGSVAGSVVGLDDHLGTHGAVTAVCVMCGEQRERLGDLLPHVGAHLPSQTTRVRLTVTRTSQPPSSHTLEVATGGMVQWGTHNTSASQSTVVEAVPARVAPAYACSECGACLAGAAQLEAHLQVHQGHPVTSTQANVTSSTTAMSTTTAIVSEPAAASTGCLCRVPGSIEFRCKECGFWREDSEPVMRHIQAVHMSGNMMHSVRLQSGLVQIHPIHVVTPISTLGPQ